MEISFIPNWILKFFSKDFLTQLNYNILLSNVILIIVFLVFKNTLLDLLGLIPHYCLFDKVIGTECPVCGTTRAFCEIAKGNFRNAYQLNSVSILIAFYFIFQIPLRIFLIINNNYSKKINYISKYISLFILLLLILIWIVNIY